VKRRAVQAYGEGGALKDRCRGAAPRGSTLHVIIAETVAVVLEVGETDCMHRAQHQ